MKLKECYDAFGGNYEEVKKRLVNDAVIQRFVVRFLSDNCYELLCGAMKGENYEEAFRAVHTLKGVSRNLSFQRLGESTNELTEYLRENKNRVPDKGRCKELLEKVTEDYKAVTDAISRL